MPASQSIRRRRRSRGSTIVRLNITSMIDMFTLMVVFLLQNYSSQGQLVTPAQGLVLPRSSVERMAVQGLTIKLSKGAILVEDAVIVDSTGYEALLAQKDFRIESLATVLTKYSEQARVSADRFGTEFSGRISIQGDVDIPYNVLTRVMYTCGQSGYPNMNLVVYRKS